jgi:RNA polymerase sigma-70 factor (ECF subfamily)
MTAPLDPPAIEDDREQVARILAGDDRALADLVDRLHGPMIRLAGAILGNAALAADAVQDAWVSVIENLARFEPRGTLRSWALRIVTNRARTLAMRLGRREQLGWLEDEPPGEEHAIDPGRFTAFGTWRDPPRRWIDSEPEGVLLRKEIRAIVARELEQLPPGPRAVVTLRDVEGLGASEVCEALGITEANERVLLHRGRSRLRDRIERVLGGKP